MNTCEQVMLITLIACSIFECFSEDEITLLAAQFSQLGDTLETMLASNAVCQENNSNTSQSQSMSKTPCSNDISDTF